MLVFILVISLKYKELGNVQRFVTQSVSVKEQIERITVMGGMTSVSLPPRVFNSSCVTSTVVLKFTDRLRCRSLKNILFLVSYSDRTNCGKLSKSNVYLMSLQVYRMVDLRRKRDQTRTEGLEQNRPERGVVRSVRLYGTNKNGIVFRFLTTRS